MSTQDLLRGIQSNATNNLNRLKQKGRGAGAKGKSASKKGPGEECLRGNNCYCSTNQKSSSLHCGAGFGIFANEFVDVAYEVEDLGIVGAPSKEEIALAEKKKKSRRLQARRKKKRQAKDENNNAGGGGSGIAGGLKDSDSKKNLNVKFVEPSLDDMSSKDPPSNNIGPDASSNDNSNNNNGLIIYRN